MILKMINRDRCRRIRPLLLEMMEERLLLATITVNTSVDENDHTDGLLSLREAIEVSDGMIPLSDLSTQEQAQVVGTLSTPNTIAFNILGSGVQTITPTSALPPITAPVIIDGYTQGLQTADPRDDAKPNSLTHGDNAVLLIELDGSHAGDANGLEIDAGGGGSTVEGLVINVSVR